MPDLTAHEASAEAAHKAKNAQQAIELARELQQTELIDKIAEKAGEKLLVGLKEVFTNDAERSPKEMKILIQRVPIICQSIIQIHEAQARSDVNIEKINTNINRVVWLIVSAVVLALLKMVLIP